MPEGYAMGMSGAARRRQRWFGIIAIAVVLIPTLALGLLLLGTLTGQS